MCKLVIVSPILLNVIFTLAIRGRRVSELEYSRPFSLSRVWEIHRAGTVGISLARILGLSTSYENDYRRKTYEVDRIMRSRTRRSGWCLRVLERLTSRSTEEYEEENEEEASRFKETRERD